MSSVSETRESGAIAHWWEVAGKLLTAGGLSGAISRTAIAPFERIKIIFQTQGQPPAYTGVMQALKKIGTEEGIRGYFKGNGVNCVRIFPTSAFQFYCYETYKRLMLDNLYPTQTDLNPIQRLYAGSSAGISALILTYPLEFVRARLTLQKTKIYNGIWDCMVQVSKKEGFFGLYRGLWPSILGVAPYVGIDFAVYETLRQYSPKQADGSVNGFITLFNGGCAGLLAQTFAFPLDTVRRRLQIQGFSSDLGLTDRHYKGVTDAFIRIYREEGVLAFYRGLVPNFLKVVPSISISFYVYEMMKKVLKIPARVPPKAQQQSPPAPAGAQPTPVPALAATPAGTAHATTNTATTDEGGNAA